MTLSSSWYISGVVLLFC